MRRLALALAVLAACDWGTLSSDELHAQWPYAEGPMFSRGSMEEAVRALEAKLGGPVVARHITLSPPQLVITVYDPKRREQDSWIYRDGDLEGPRPERTEREDTVETFALRDVAFDRFRELLDRAHAELKIAGGRAEYISVVPTREGAQIRIDVRGPRSEGTARFTAKGELIDAKLD